MEPKSFSIKGEQYIWDAFVSHASEDKDSFVRDLVAGLKRLGIKVWFDEDNLEIGDSIRRSVDLGLGSSKYGIVVLSKSFFCKEWPQKELDALVNREDGREKIILPIWHGITYEDVRRFSPLLADKLAISTGEGTEAVITRLANVIVPKLSRKQGSTRLLTSPKFGSSGANMAIFLEGVSGNGFDWIRLEYMLPVYLDNNVRSASELEYSTEGDRNVTLSALKGILAVLCGVPATKLQVSKPLFSGAWNKSLHSFFEQCSYLEYKAPIIGTPEKVRGKPYDSFLFEVSRNSFELDLFRGGRPIPKLPDPPLFSSRRQKAVKLSDFKIPERELRLYLRELAASLAPGSNMHISPFRLYFDGDSGWWKIRTKFVWT